MDVVAVDMLTLPSVVESGPAALGAGVFFAATAALGVGMSF